jgi:hypothetical protein
MNGLKYRGYMDRTHAVKITLHTIVINNGSGNPANSTGEFRMPK